MEIIPAIDIRGGKCVRLYQGDYSRETVFSDDPLEIAIHWQSMGVPRLHLVDLDGAARGKLQNFDVIEQIVGTVKVPTQLGGGIRSLAAMERAFRAGIDRVIMGTAAVENRALVEEACRRFGRSIVVGVDVRDSYVATHGWRRGTTITAVDFIRQMAALGVERFIYTDISRDGTLTEPNFEAIAELAAATQGNIVASGGISSIAHLQRLSALGIEGVIVGKALYTGDIDLRVALALVK